MWPYELSTDGTWHSIYGPTILHWCMKKQEYCQYANENGYCSTTMVCVKNVSYSDYTKDIKNNKLNV